MYRAALLVSILGVLSPASAAEPTLEEILDSSDDYARGDSSIAKIQMEVHTRRYQRTMAMQAWSEGTEKTLIRILEPAKDRGIATLKVDDHIWNYLPKVDRTMKVPAAMMSGSWMGSHFTNDDLVKESRLSEDFTGSVLERPENGQGNYLVELIPRPDAPVVWGKVEIEVRPDLLPLEFRYYDEHDALVRTMTFGDFKELGGRTMPATMTLQPADEPEEFTRITYLELSIDPKIDPSMFSVQSLRP